MSSEFPTWKARKIYNIDDKVEYRGNVYICLVKHKSTNHNNPSRSTVLWEVHTVPAPVPSPTPAPAPTPTPAPVGVRRGMWVWNGYEVAASPTAFLDECKRIKVTDVYLYLTASNYTRTTILRSFISKATALGIRVWGLDGARAYFSDASGPNGLYATVRQLIAYNNIVGPNERFHGFQTDNEPDDYSGRFPDTFHNDIKTSALSKTSNGLFTNSAYEDRMFILRDWLSTQKTVTDMLRQVRLVSGAALPSWLDDYYGEPLTVTFAGVTGTMMVHMMALIDEYCIMSYQTDLNKVSTRISGELVYGNTFGGKKAVFAGVEVNKGRGSAVNYGDHPTKNSKSAVLADLTTMETLFKKHVSFAGVNIHDWTGWQALKAS